MAQGSFTHFRKLRRMLCLATVTSQVLWVAAIAMVPLGIGGLPWCSIACALLAGALGLTLPMEEITNARLAARGWRPVEIGADMIRAGAVLAMIVWIGSLPEFGPLISRVYNPASWGWQFYLSVVLWFGSRAYRQCFAIMALTDRQIYRYYRGVPADEAGTQSFRKIG